MADAKLSALALSTTADRVYGELGGVSKALTPFNLAGPIVPKTANYAVLAADTLSHFDNVGAAGAVNFTLPAAALGLRYTFVVYAAQSVTVTAAGTDKIAIGAENSAGGGNIVSAEPFNAVTLEAHGTGQWVALSATGTWTVT